MPWTKKQVRVAEAVKHGWQPKGKAKNFSKAFATQVITETDSMSGKTTTKKTKRAKTS